MPKLMHRHSRNRDTAFMQYLMAVTYVESRFNSQALSDEAAYGLLQMTEVAMLDTVESCGLPVIGMDKLYDAATNVAYGSCYLNKALKETEGDWTRALIIYNGGYRQLIRYNSGLAIAPETASYVLQVTRALEICNAGVLPEVPGPKGRNAPVDTTTSSMSH